MGASPGAGDAPPVVLIIFNRPDATARVLNALRVARPARVFVVGDGPRPDRAEDAPLCTATRALLSTIDWPCDVETHFAAGNMGLRRRVVSGLNWVFDQVESAIILEDDCVPDATFFTYCASLLNHYRDDPRVMAIAGSNFQRGRRRGPYSYYFSRYSHCWGWATWRRAWRLYDDAMNQWPSALADNWLSTIFDDSHAIAYWARILQAVYDERITSWAYRWAFTCWRQGALTALPQVNLVSNIGFGEGATHSRRRSANVGMAAESLALPVRHPPAVVRDVAADAFTQATHFGTGPWPRTKRRVRRWLLGARAS